MLENKKLFLLDIDGTICKGNQLVEGSATFLKDIKANKIAPRRYGIDVTLKGAEVLPEKRMLSVNAGNKRDVAYINHHKLIFKANAPEVEVIFDNAKAQDGEELILNFIQLTPYFNL